jgi:cation diffusion facilitator family transporter
VQEGSRRAIVAAFLANLGIAASKFVGFLVTRSAGMLAESVHSVADTGNQLLLLLGSKRAQRPADRAHPFGYGPERYFWGFVVALVLFSMGGLFALYEGIEKLRHPHELDNPVVAFVILGVAVALEAFSLATAVRESRHVKPHEMGWWRFVRASKSPEFPVVLLEDTGAQAGLLFAIVGLVMAEVTGNPRWDALGSIAIGVLLVAIALVLGVEMKGLLIGEAASDLDEAAVRGALGSAPGVNSVIHVRTMHLGPESLLVAAKIDFDHSFTVEELAGAIDATEARLRAAVPKAAMVFLEPDIRRSAGTSSGAPTGEAG